MSFDFDTLWPCFNTLSWDVLHMVHATCLPSLQCFGRWLLMESVGSNYCMLLFRRHPSLSPEILWIYTDFLKHPVHKPTCIKWTVPRRLLMWMSCGYPFVSMATNNRILFLLLPHASGGPPGGAVNVWREEESSSGTPSPLSADWRQKVDSEYFSVAPVRNKYDFVPIYGPMAKCFGAWRLFLEAHLETVLM